jgi:small subunit ribosomal protein S1
LGVQVMVLSNDRKRGRIRLSTKHLEASPGDMMRDPQSVYENAEQRAAEFRERKAAIATLQVHLSLVPHIAVHCTDAL